MISLNFSNTEEIIFWDSKIKEKLPEFKNLFDQWKLSKTIPGMSMMGKRSILDFLSYLRPEHIEVIKQHMNCDISVEKMNHKTIENFTFPLDDVEKKLNEINPNGNFCTHLEGNQLYISFWR